MSGINCTDDPRLPSGICTTCRKALQGGNSRHVLPPPINLRTLIYDHPTRASPHKTESCYVCCLAKMDIIAAQEMLKTASNSSNSAQAPGKLCEECYLPISEETGHKCIPAVLPSIEKIDSASGKSDEQQAAQVVRKMLVSEASSKRGEKYGNVTLATGGPPMHVEVKRPKMEPAATATSEQMVQHMQQQNFSLNQIKKEQKFVRDIFGAKSVEPHCREKVVDATHHLDEFFEVKVMEFIEKIKKL